MSGEIIWDDLIVAGSHSSFVMKRNTKKIRCIILNDRSNKRPRIPIIIIPTNIFVWSYK